MKFATALQTNKLLKPQYTEMLTTGKVDSPLGSKYAYGWLGFIDGMVNGTRCFATAGARRG